MVQHRHREETVNTQLALLISKMGVRAEAEAILSRGSHRPDVLFTLRGLRVVVEGKFADHPGAEVVVLDDARSRVAQSIAHVAVAAVYPRPLRTAATGELESRLQTARLRFKIVSESGETPGWLEGGPADLMTALRRVQESLAQDNIVEATANALSSRLEGIAYLWSGQAGTCDRLSTILGMPQSSHETAGEIDARRETAAKVSALVIANALIFQEQLSKADGRIQSLGKLDGEPDPLSAAKRHWNWIWTNVNYVPIFQLGERVLTELTVSGYSISAMRGLIAEAKAICANQAALRHDLMGRIYHWLLHHAKFLGTYYTSVSAATLLLKLALSRPWDTDFGDPAALAEFKVGDLACGTGTLLMATAQALSDAYISDRASSGRTLNPTDLNTLHRTLMENVLHGYDVLPSAVHLTASTLALLAPEVSFVRMNLFIMPMGMDGNTPRLGSLDLLGANRVPTQISLDYSQAETVKTGAGLSQITNATVSPLDLCVMNPPFVRSVGGNLLFGSLPPEERAKLQDELKERVQAASQTGRPSNITAGLGSVFVALADLRLKSCGRLAFVLPAALASGEAWADTRALIAERYHLELVISSHDATRPNFSENTALSELLFIARKCDAKDRSDKRTVYVSLLRNPRSIHEALDLAERIRRTQAATIEGVTHVSLDGITDKLGEIVSMPSPVGNSNWTGALFAQIDLLRAWWMLERGQVCVPGTAAASLPTCSLSELGVLGYDRRDIHDAFTVSRNTWSPYPAFWGHIAKQVRSIKQRSNAQLLARTTPARGRHLKDASQVWSKAGRMLLVERVRTNTHRLLAVGFDGPVLGNTWWALKTELTAEQEKALLLWLNSSLSLLLLFGRRVVTEGAWMQMKKPAWASMPVLDVRRLDSRQLATLAAAFDALSSKELMPLSQLEVDPVRRQIDSALSASLKLQDLDNLRSLFSREPGLSAAATIPSTTGEQSESED